MDVVEVVDDDKNSAADCIVCQKKYSRKSGLYRHLREVHKVEIQFAGRKHKFKCPDPACSVTFQMNEKIRDHITEVHGVKIEMCSKYFKSFSEFEQWKDAVQHKMKSLYVSAQTKRSPNNNRYKYYTCHRSGGYTETKSVGRRKACSKKIDGWCPSGMDTHIFSNGGVNVKFWMTHFGHEIEIDRLNLSRKEKMLIAKKVKDGQSIDKILDDIRDSLVNDDIRRIHLLSRQDIVNICQALKITNKESLIEKDNTSIVSWLDSMEALGDSCPVIFFKDKGAVYELLKTNDFVLFLMTQVQQKLLESCDNRLICMDSIITCNYFNYYLVTLLTVDDLEVACPLAFCVTNRIDDNVIALFLSFIKSRTGPITGTVFMSADNPSFYSSWEKEMGPIDIRLLCSWNIDQNWRKNLEKIPCSEEKKLRTYKEMRLIMQEPNFENFRSRLEEIVLQFDEDEEMKNFSSFLRTKYIERSNLWAFCYRSQELIKYNAMLEQIHRDLHECYAEGRIANSLPRVLNLIMEFSRDKVLEKIEKRPRQFQIRHLGSADQSHNETQEIDVVTPQDIPEKQLKVPTVDCLGSVYQSHNETQEIEVVKPQDIPEKQLKVPTVDCLGSVYQSYKETQEIDVVKTQGMPGKHLKVPTVEKDTYHVTHNLGKECPFHCEPICVACKICFHRFTCTCTENVVNMNICRHIYASVNLMKSQCKHTEEERLTGVKTLDPVLAGGEMRVFKEEIIEIDSDKEDDDIVEIDNDMTVDDDVLDEDGGEDMNCDADDSNDANVNECNNSIADECKDANTDESKDTNTVECKDANTDECNAANTDKHNDANTDESNDANVNESNDTENVQTVLLQKVVYIYDTLMNKMLTPDQYKHIDEYLDKMIEISNGTS